MTTFVDACALNDIPQEDVRRFDHAGRSYAIYRSLADEVFCTDGFCSHEAVHLSDGMVMDYEIECPKHSGIFDIRTGEAKRLPACVNLKTYATKLDGERILIAVG